MIAFCCRFFLFVHGAVCFMSSLFLLLFVICHVVFWVVLLYIIHPSVKNCILLHLLYFSFFFQAYCCLFFQPSFISFTQSNEWCFVAVFLICFVVFWQPLVFLVCPKFLPSINPNRWTTTCCCCVFLLFFCLFVLVCSLFFSEHFNDSSFLYKIW